MVQTRKKGFMEINADMVWLHWAICPKSLDTFWRERKRGTEEEAEHRKSKRGTPRHAMHNSTTGKEREEERERQARRLFRHRTDDLFRHATLLPFYMAVETTRGQWPYRPEADKICLARVHFNFPFTKAFSVFASASGSDLPPTYPSPVQS